MKWILVFALYSGSDGATVYQKIEHRTKELCEASQKKLKDAQPSAFSGSRLFVVCMETN